jgi:hypothetical protein
VRIIAQTKFLDAFKQRSGQRQNLQSAGLVGFQLDLLTFKVKFLPGDTGDIAQALSGLKPNRIMPRHFSSATFGSCFNSGSVNGRRPRI